MAREKSSHKPGKSYGQKIYEDVKESVEVPVSLVASNTIKLGRFVYHKE